MSNYQYNTQNQSYFRVLVIIHLALLLGQVFFAVVVYSITKRIGFASSTNDPLFL